MGTWVPLYLMYGYSDPPTGTAEASMLEHHYSRNAWEGGKSDNMLCPS